MCEIFFFPFFRILCLSKIIFISVAFIWKSSKIIQLLKSYLNEFKVRMPKSQIEELTGRSRADHFGERSGLDWATEAEIWLNWNRSIIYYEQNVMEPLTISLFRNRRYRKSLYETPNVWAQTMIQLNDWLTWSVYVFQFQST